jgi:acetyl esterase/lipase
MTSFSNLRFTIGCEVAETLNVASSSSQHPDDAALGIPLMARTEAPAQPDAVPLYPNMKPASVAEAWYEVGGEYIVRNVSHPTLTPVLPEPARATGAAVIVAPGGAFMILSIGHEGWNVARQLADQGIAAFVLKYRLNRTPQDEEGFGLFMRRRMGEVVALAPRGRNPEIKETRATQDALAAVRMVRLNAAKWGIDPGRVGIMGFSAGAITAIQAAITQGSADRPDFIAPFYPPLVAVEVPDDAPAMFAAIAFDDQYFGKQDLALIEAWRKARRPVEFHGYERGGHGFGLGRPGTTTSVAFHTFLLWMQSRDLLPTKTSTPP